MVPAAILAAVLMVVSCDKNNSKPADTTLQKIQAKWNLTSIYSKYGSEDTTYNGISGDYIQLPHRWKSVHQYCKCKRHLSLFAGK